jgi:hypothetical protein
VSSESERELSMEELKRLNHPQGSMMRQEPDHTGTAGVTSDAGGVDGTDEYAGLAGAPRGRAGGPRTGAFPEAENVPDPGADRGAGAGCGGSAGDDATGWEAERAAYLSPAAASAHSTSQPGMATDPGNLAGALGNVAQLGHALERTQDDVPVKDATTHESVHRPKSVHQRA